MQVMDEAATLLPGGGCRRGLPGSRNCMSRSVRTRSKTRVRPRAVGIEADRPTDSGAGRRRTWCMRCTSSGMRCRG